MNKAIIYTKNGALLFGLGNGFFNTIKQLEKNNTPFNWKQMFQAVGKGAFVGATGGFVLGSIEDKRMSRILNHAGGSVPKYLDDILKKHNRADNDFVILKANQIKDKLYDKFKQDLIGQPNFNGSSVKGTSIQGSDIDIQIRFKKHIGSIEQNFNSVSEFLEDEFNDSKDIEIRKQKHSIGIAYKLDGEKKRIDIVPSRISKNRNDDDYIYVNNTSIFEQSTLKKINSSKQLKAFDFTIQEKRVIKLLKVLKNENDINIKSIYLELLVKKAFQSKIISKNIDKSLLDVLNYIAENIHKLRIVDPANTNNIISETLTYEEKVSLSYHCYDMISEIQKDKINIIDYFPNCPAFLN